MGLGLSYFAANSALVKPAMTVELITFGIHVLCVSDVLATVHRIIMIPLISELQGFDHVFGYDFIIFLSASEFFPLLTVGLDNVMVGGFATPHNQLGDHAIAVFSV